MANAPTSMGFDEFIRTYGDKAALDHKALKGTGLDDPNAFQVADGGSYNEQTADSYTGTKFIAETEQKIAKYKDYKVVSRGADQDKTYWEIVSPSGKKQSITTKNHQNNAMDKVADVMPAILLSAMAPGVGSALSSSLGLGLGASGAAALGGGALNTAFAASQGQDPSKAIIGSLLAGGLSSIPGFSGLPVAAQAALRGGATGAVSGGGKGALIGAITGGIGGTAGAAGVNPVAKTLLTTLLRNRMISSKGMKS